MKKASKSSSKHLSKTLDRLAYKDPDDFEIVVRCPLEKEFNHITQRCVKMCKEGFERNREFKCIKTRKIKYTKSIKPKICPPNKEINPNTNRCVKNCPPSYFRNTAFQCRKRKYVRTQKQSSTINKSKTRSSRH